MSDVVMNWKLCCVVLFITENVYVTSFVVIVFLLGEGSHPNQFEFVNI